MQTNVDDDVGLPARPRDAAAAYFMYFAVAVVLASLACAALATAFLLGILEAALAGPLFAILAGGFAVHFAYRLYRLFEKSALGQAERMPGEEAPGPNAFAEVLRLPVVDVSVSRSARRLIAQRGGQAYVWVDDVGRDFVWLSASTRDPRRRRFRRKQVDGIEVFVAADLNVPKLKLRRSRLLPWRLVAEWPGYVVTG